MDFKCHAMLGRAQFPFLTGGTCLTTSQRLASLFLYTTRRRPFFRKGEKEREKKKTENVQLLCAYI